MKTIEEKRRVVIDNIDEWLRRLAGEPPRRWIRKPEKEDGDFRLMRLSYGCLLVSLHRRGAKCILRRADCDQVAFWEMRRQEVLSGKYDFGINQAAEKLSRRARGIPSREDWRYFWCKAA